MRKFKIKVMFYVLSWLFLLNAIIMRIQDNDNWFARFTLAVFCAGIFYILNDIDKINPS